MFYAVYIASIYFYKEYLTCRNSVRAWLFALFESYKKRYSMTYLFA